MYCAITFDAAPWCYRVQCKPQWTLFQQALFAEELNEANERASFFQARVSQLEAELLQPLANAPTVADRKDDRSGNMKAMLSSAAKWVVTGNRWSVYGGDNEV